MGVLTWQSGGVGSSRCGHLQHVLQEESLLQALLRQNGQPVAPRSLHDRSWSLREGVTNHTTKSRGDNLKVWCRDAAVTGYKRCRR